MYWLYTCYAAACPSFNINYPPMRTLLCPGDNIAYTCAITSAFITVTTQWSGSGFQCTPSGLSNNTITLTQGAGQPLNPTVVSCGNLSAVMTNISGTCYTSVLTIPTPQYYNGTTILCNDNFGAVGTDTLNIQLACKLDVILFFFHGLFNEASTTCTCTCVHNVLISLVLHFLIWRGGGGVPHFSSL